MIQSRAFQEIGLKSNVSAQCTTISQPDSHRPGQKLSGLGVALVQNLSDLIIALVQTLPGMMFALVQNLSGSVIALVQTLPA